MNYRKKSFILLGVSTLLLFIVHIINTLDCSSALRGKCFLEFRPLIFGYNIQYSVPLIVLTLLLIVVMITKEAVIKAWLKFTAFTFPVYALLLYLFASSSGGPEGFMSPGYASVSGEVLVLALSILYLFISLLIIIIKSIRLAGAEEKKK